MAKKSRISNFSKFLIIIIIIFGSVYLINYFKSSKNNIPIIDNLIINSPELKNKVNEIENKLTSPNIDINNIDVLDGYKIMKIAEVYQYGKFDFPRNIEKAISLYKLSIKKGEKSCYGKLGDIYYEGTDTLQPDAEKALFYYTEAIKNGNTNNLYNIAQIYHNGIHPKYSPNTLAAQEIYELIIQEGENKFNKWTISKAKENILDIRSYDNNNFFNNEGNSQQLPGNLVYDIKKLLNNKNTPNTPDKPNIREINQNIERNNNGNNPVTEIRRFIARNLEGDMVRDNHINFIFTDDPLEEIVFNQGGQIRNDSQNVHDSDVSKSTLSSLNKIRKLNSQQNCSKDFDTCHTEVMDSIFSDKYSSSEKENAIKLMDSLSRFKHSRYNDSEKDIFKEVWNRINSKDNEVNKDELVTSFIKSLDSGIEYDKPVCSTGKIVRMISSLEKLDNNDIVNIKPGWAFDKEIGDMVVNTREKMMKDKGDSFEKLYNEYNPDVKNNGNNEVEMFIDDVKNNVKKQAYDSYVNSDILTQNELDIKLEPYLDNI